MEFGKQEVSSSFRVKHQGYVGQVHERLMHGGVLQGQSTLVRFVRPEKITQVTSLKSGSSHETFTHIATKSNPL